MILPCDLLVREFDAKLLLSCVAAERGFNALVGAKLEMFERVQDWPRGCYIHKDVQSRPGMLKRLRQLGHHVMAWDEEALVVYSPERYVDLRVSPEVIGTPEALFAWGPANARAWQSSRHYAGTPIHVTGNPRGDLMRRDLVGYFEDDAARLRERFGQFVLLNTNFGMVNNYVTKAARVYSRSWREEASQKDGFAEGMTKFRQELLADFLAAVPRLARALPQTTIVVRPHPSEHPAPWQQAAEGCDNVQVLHEGNVTPWLLAASVVVHNGCSTGLEAHLLGRPTLAFAPRRSALYDIPLPNAVSQRVDSTDELIEAVAAALAGSLPNAAAAEQRDRVVAENIAALQGPLASDRIIDVLEIAADAGTPTGAGIRDRFQRLLSRAVPRRSDGAPKPHKRQRFPDTPIAAVEGMIQRLRGSLGRFQGVTARQFAPNVFQIARR